MKLSEDEDVHIRLEAIGVLGRKVGHEVLLLAALTDDYSGVRIAAAKALAANGASLAPRNELMGENYLCS